jgi:hypothetical protein
MVIGEQSVGLAIVLASELLALWLIWRLWQSDDHVFFKISLSFLVLFPILGPLMVLWISNFPSSKPRILRDNLRYRTDFYDRWRHVLEEKNPVRRFRSWRELMTQHRNEDP